MCGYTLLGTNPRQVMFILYGRGRNGKSKTIEVLARIFSDYAVNIAADSLMARRFENARSDLARLAGARLATAAEGAEGARMDEAIIKQLTGEYAVLGPDPGGEVRPGHCGKTARGVAGHPELVP